MEATGKPGKPVLRRVNCSGSFGHIRLIELAKVILTQPCTRRVRGLMDPSWILVVMIYDVMNQKQTATASANNGSARVLYNLVHFFPL